MKQKFKDFFRVPTNLRIIICVVLTAALFAVYAVICTGNLANPVIAGIILIVIYIFLAAGADFAVRMIELKKAGVQTNEITPILGNITLDLIINIYMPILICDENGRIIWANRAFTAKTDKRSALYGERIDDYTGMPISVITSDEHTDGVELIAFGSFFRVKSYKIESHNKSYILTVWNDKTELSNAYRRLTDENTLIAYIMIDNIEELQRYSRDKTSEGEALVIDQLKKWTVSVGGVLKEYEREKFIMIFDAHHLNDFTENKFEILDKIRDIRVGEGTLPITVSIGISGSDGTLSDKEREAAACLDMALQRGGDQAVVKTGEGLDFYGGRTKTIQKRTKVRARVVANELASRMSVSSNVIIMGHKNTDFDAIGASVGMARLAMFCGVRVNIVVNKKDINYKRCAERIMSVPEYAENEISPIFIEGHDALDLVSTDTLLIIVDVNNRQQYELPELADIASNVVIIDHHRKTAEFEFEPIISYIEASVSSACELVSEILEQSLPERMLQKNEADILYAGILLDTNQFTRNTGVRTFSAALYLRGEGANPGDAQTLFKTEIDDFRREAKFESNVVIYRDVFAVCISDSDDNTSVDRIAAAKAANKLLGVNGISASFAICRIGDVIHISARSAGTVNVQLILEKLNGGGHFDSAATQLNSITVNSAVDMLKCAIDEYLDETTDEQ